MPADHSGKFPRSFNGAILSENSKVAAELLIDAVGSCRPLQYALRYKQKLESSFNIMNLNGTNRAELKFTDNTVSISDGRKSFTFFGVTKTVAEIKKVYQEIVLEVQLAVTNKHSAEVTLLNVDENVPTRLMQPSSALFVPRSVTSRCGDANEGAGFTNGGIRSGCSVSVGNGSVKDDRLCHRESVAESESFKLRPSVSSINVTHRHRAKQAQRGLSVRATNESRDSADTFSKSYEPEVKPLKRSAQHNSSLAGHYSMADYTDDTDADADVENEEVTTPKKSKHLDASRQKHLSPKIGSPPSKKRCVNTIWTHSDQFTPAIIRQLLRYGFIGFPNVGNSCYMNAVLQVLFALPTFASDLKIAVNHWECLADRFELLDDAKTSMIFSLHRLLENRPEFSTDLQGAEDFIDDLKIDLEHVRSILFKDHGQKDAQEFLCKLLEVVEHEPSSWAHQIFNLQKNQCRSISDETTSSTRTSDVVKCLCAACSSSACNLPNMTLPESRFDCINVQKFSPTESNFVFDVDVRSTCSLCDFEKCVTEKTSTLLVNVVKIQSSNAGIDDPWLMSSQSQATLQDLVDWSAIGDRVHMNCENCGSQNALHRRRRHFLSLPRIFIIVALRYRYDSHGEKLEQPFHVPRFVTLCRFVNETVQIQVPTPKAVAKISPSSSSSSSSSKKLNFLQAMRRRNGAALSSAAALKSGRSQNRVSINDGAVDFDSDLEEGNANWKRERIENAMASVENDMALPDINGSTMSEFNPQPFSCLQDVTLNEDEALQMALQRSVIDYADTSCADFLCQQSPNGLIDNLTSEASSAMTVESRRKLETNDVPRSNNAASELENSSVRCSVNQANIDLDRPGLLVDSNTSLTGEPSKLAKFASNVSVKEECSPTRTRLLNCDSSHVVTEEVCGGQLDGADAFGIDKQSMCDIGPKGPTLIFHPSKPPHEEGADQDDASIGERRSDDSTRITNSEPNGVDANSMKSSVTVDPMKEQAVGEIDCTMPIEDDCIEQLAAIDCRASSSVLEIERETDLYSNNDRENIQRILDNAHTGSMPHSYRLVGVVSHHGHSLNDGHYVSDVYKAETRQWTRCDDQYLSMIREETLLDEASRDGYIFFYAHKDVLDQLSKHELTNLPSD